MKSLDDLFSVRLRRVQRESIAAGLLIGSVSSLLVLGAIGLGLDRWRERNDARLRAEAIAAVAQREEVCRLKLQRMEAVVALADQIDAAMGER